MESTKVVHLGSLDDSQSIAESDHTDGLESSVEYDFDDDDDDDDEHCEVNRDNFDGYFDGGINSNSEAETLKDFVHKDEGKIYAEGHAIRLLRLEGGAGRIHGCLFKGFLHKSGDGLNGLPYDALSYTWGTNEKTKPIILNGKRFMVTENLYSVLQCLRFKNEDRILWIDAICIDQSHVAERNHQVGHMASIYCDADRVLFWLGEPTYETDFLISSLIRLQEQASNTSNMTRQKEQDSRWRELWDQEQLDLDFPLLSRGLALLLARPWFKRSWILQEVCFAETGVVICGTKAIAAHIFALLLGC
jgi:hypothetical protein